MIKIRKQTAECEVKYNCVDMLMSYVDLNYSKTLKKTVVTNRMTKIQQQNVSNIHNSRIDLTANSK